MYDGKISFFSKKKKKIIQCSSIEWGMTCWKYVAPEFYRIKQQHNKQANKQTHTQNWHWTHRRNTEE